MIHKTNSNAYQSKEKIKECKVQHLTLQLMQNSKTTYLFLILKKKHFTLQSRVTYKRIRERDSSYSHEDAK